jgi:hypothetical protein
MIQHFLEQVTARVVITGTVQTALQRQPGIMCPFHYPASTIYVQLALIPLRAAQRAVHALGGMLSAVHSVPPHQRPGRRVNPPVNLLDSQHGNRPVSLLDSQHGNRPVSQLGNRPVSQLGSQRLSHRPQQDNLQVNHQYSLHVNQHRSLRDGQRDSQQVSRRDNRRDSRPHSRRHSQRDNQRDVRQGNQRDARQDNQLILQDSQRGNQPDNQHHSHRCRLVRRPGNLQASLPDSRQPLLVDQHANQLACQQHCRRDNLQMYL